MSTAATDEGKKAGPDAPPVQLGWDTHKPVVSRIEISVNVTCFLMKEKCVCSVIWIGHIVVPVE